MKIMLLNLWPQGGMRHYSDSLATLILKNHQLVYVTNYDSEPESALAPFTINIGARCSVAALIIKLNTIIGKQRPDVIHVNSNTPALLLSYVFLHHKTRMVYTLHDVVPHAGDRMLKRMFTYIDLILSNLFFDRVILHSEVLVNQVPRVLDRAKYRVVPHMSYALLATPCSKVKMEGKLAILFFGRILAYKGLDFLFRALTMMPKGMIKLVIAGEGVIEPPVPSGLNVEVINRFIGDSELAEIFGKVDAVVLPYLSASQSGVAYLALAFNKPVIATNVGAISDVIKPNTNGILVRPNDVPELVSALWRMSDQRFYSQLVGNMGCDNANHDNVVLSALSVIYQELA